MLAAFVLAVALAADEAPWSKPDLVEGVSVQARPVKGSAFVELKLGATSAASPERLCAEAFGNGKLDPRESSVFSRKVVEETADTRITYEQLSAPFISNRDYAVLATRTRLDSGACEVLFVAANDRAPAVPPGFVRIEKLRGVWRFEPQADGKTRLTYVLHTDPAGAIPPLFAEGSRRKVALDWVKLIVGRAEQGKVR